MSSESKDRTDPEAGKDGAGGSRRGLIVRVLIGAILAPLLTFLVLVLLRRGRSRGPRETAAGHTVPRGGNRIVAPDGTRFIVKGVAIPYGTFAGGDTKGLGALNFATVDHDLRRLKGLGVNTIKILVTPRPGDRTQLPRLRTVVGYARRQGFVVEISPAVHQLPAGGGPYRGSFAREYRDDSYVWLQPMNEPNCPRGTPLPLLRLVLWQRQQRTIIAGSGRRG